MATTNHDNEFDPPPTITTASHLRGAFTVGVLVDGIEVGWAPDEEGADACAAELRSRPDMAAAIRDEPRDAEDDRRAVTR